jgi:FkbH-like protein
MESGLDYARLLKEARSAGLADGIPAIRVALLGDSAIQQFTPLLRALSRRAGFAAEIYEGGFDGVEFDALNPASSLYRFDPEVIIVLNAVQGLRDKYYQRSGDAAGFARDTMARLTRVWDAIKEYCRAQVIHANFVAPIERVYGNYDLKVASSLSSTVARLNALLAEEAERRSHVLLLDVDQLASWVGRKEWFDERFWTLSKSFCAPGLLPLVAKNIVDIVLSTKGRSVKCVVLDLDNTLWGGVVGDDGVQGIRINAHGEGEDFYRFQCFLRELKNRGILLAVCSKNEHANAVLPFEENAAMVLKLDDFAVFVANWDNKVVNIRKIRQALNIGLDSMVFLDDNPFERNLVREMLPDVIVPELPDDPSEYVQAICALNLFETSTHAAEDAHRTEFYRVEAQRELAKATTVTFEEFLQALDMKIEVARFVPENLPRIAQLLQRSNQFNLTTHRYTQAQCEAMMNDTELCVPLTASLSDRFGDHGLISIVVLRPGLVAETLTITDWLMSCRVLTRGVEEYLMNLVVEEAQRRGLRRVGGEFIPTAKNGMVREFFGRFGFEKACEDIEGRAEWVLDTGTYVRRSVFIRPAVAADSSSGRKNMETT